MSWVLVLSLVAIAVAFLVLLVASRKAGGGSIGYPYQGQSALFSAAERSFLGVLDQAVGPDHRVFGKVRLGDLAKVKPGLSPSARQGALNRVAAKHLDFVVCRADDLSVVCAVELNDKSHGSRRAQVRDELVSKVCEAIGLRLVVFPAKQAYVVSEVRAEVVPTEAAPVLVASGT